MAVSPTRPHNRAALRRSSSRRRILAVWGNSLAFTLEGALAANRIWEEPAGTTQPRDPQELGGPSRRRLRTVCGQHSRAQGHRVAIRVLISRTYWRAWR